MKIRTKNIESTGDVSILSPYVENILYTRLDLENLDLLSEEYIIQLITLLQLIGQYLVYTQNGKLYFKDNNEEFIIKGVEIKSSYPGYNFSDYTII